MLAMLRLYLFGHWRSTLGGLGLAVSILCMGDVHNPATWAAAACALGKGIVGADAAVVAAQAAAQAVTKGAAS